MITSNSATVLLDRKLTVSQAQINNEVKRILTGVIHEAILKVFHDYYYRVDFGPDVRPQYHIVSYDLFCTCALEQDCPAVEAVKLYLREGGEPTSMPRPGYFLTVPHVCPVCGAKAYYHPQLSSHYRGIGWSCEKGGNSHYWQHEIAVLQAAFTEKWKILGMDPASFGEIPHFGFKDGYDPE